MLYWNPSFDLPLDSYKSPPLLYVSPLFRCSTQIKTYCIQRRKEKQQKMVSIRLTIFVSGLLMFNLLAFTHQAKEKLVDEGQEVSVLATEKDILDGISTTASHEVNGRSGEIGGRKMTKKKEEEISVNGEIGSKILGATHIVGDCNHKGEIKHKIDGRLRKRSSSTHHQVKVKKGSFMALNADYHTPKSHPPKNN